jgi:hypothetical protein
VSASPPGPSQVVGGGVPGSGDQVGQAFDLGDGEYDRAGVGGWFVVGTGRRRWQSRVGLSHRGGGDGVDCQGGDGQGDVVERRTWLWSNPKWSFLTGKSSSTGHGPTSPTSTPGITGTADQWIRRLAFALDRAWT